MLPSENTYAGHWETVADCVENTFIYIMYIIYLYIYTIICILNLLLPAQSKILKQNKYLVKKEGKMKFFQQQGGEITQVMQAMNSGTHSTLH